MAEQGGLIFHVNNEEISDAVIVGKCPTLKHAIVFCADLSQIPYQDLAFQLDMEYKHFTRCMNVNDDRHFPPDKFNDLMDVAGNEVPLRWLALKRGYGLHRLKTAVELENEELRKKVEMMERERLAVVSFFKSGEIDVNLPVVTGKVQ